jgi:phenylacetate-coenzyme A ligase PaaK-like adenylate-forming protein
MVYGHYGMTETGLGGGVECAARDGYHLREADLLFEVVDPSSGRPVPDGEYGEVVFTTLTRRGMPLVRYRTGDRARFLTEACPCGTVLRRLGRVTNRLAEPVTLSGGGTLSIALLDEVIYREPSVAAYAAALYTKDGQDCLHITVLPAGGRAELDIVSRRLRSALPDVFSGGLLLELTAGDAGYFTTGTLKRSITDHRNNKTEVGNL